MEAEPEPTKSDSKIATPLHPAYTVTDISCKVRTLDGVKVTYSSWAKLFQLHASSYKVSSHIDGTAAPANTDPDYDAWEDIDSLVLQWIYGTLNDDLLVRVLKVPSSAREAWTRIGEIFLNTKGSRAAALEQEFTNVSLQATPSLEAYCQRLKELADQLSDVDNPVTERRLVLQLVRGLPMEFDTVRTFINRQTPTWDTACSMLQLEQLRHAARDQQVSTRTAANSGNVFAVVDTDDAQRSLRPKQHPRVQHPHVQPKKKNPQGNGKQQWSRKPIFPPFPPFLTGHQQHHNLNNWPNFPPWPTYTNNIPGPWYPPPCPYPIQPNWTPTWQPRQSPRPNAHTHSRQPSNSSDQANLTQFDAMDPTQLQAAFSAMHMNQLDTNWYMDSGAISHLTGDQGLEEWDDPEQT